MTFAFFCSRFLLCHQSFKHLCQILLYPVLVRKIYLYIFFSKNCLQFGALKKLRLEYEEPFLDYSGSDYADADRDF
jgi:hypothetical protein